MKVLVIGGHYNPVRDLVITDGLSKFSLTVAKAYHLSGHEVHLLGSKDSQLDLTPIPLHKWDVESRRQFALDGQQFPHKFSKAALRKMTELKDIGFDLVLNNLENRSAIVNIPLIFNQSKVVNCIHSSGYLGISSVDRATTLAKTYLAGAGRVLNLIVCDHNKHVHNKIAENAIQVVNTSAIFFDEDLPDLSDVLEEELTYCTLLARLQDETQYSTIRTLLGTKYPFRMIGDYSPHLDTPQKIKDNFESLLSHPQVTRYRGLPHRDILRILSRSKFSVFLTPKEVLPISPIEHNLMGCPVIGSEDLEYFPDCLTFVGEPYSLNTKRTRQYKIDLQMADLLPKMLAEYDLSNRMALSKKTFERFHYTKWISRMDSLLEGVQVLPEEPTLFDSIFSA